jgi:hypothetical protein
MCFAGFLRRDRRVGDAWRCHSHDQSVLISFAATILILLLDSLPGCYSFRGLSLLLSSLAALTLRQLTGALSHVLPIMISVMISKWVGDAIGKDGGIYAVWIAMRGYPWLPPIDFHDKGETGAQLMRPLERLVVIEDERESVADLGMCRFLIFCDGSLMRALAQLLC